MIEPFPKARSICDKAASSALVLSTEVPSTRRRLACVTAVFPFCTISGKTATAAACGHLCMICSHAQVLFLFSDGALRERKNISLGTYWSWQLHAISNFGGGS